MGNCNQLTPPLQRAIRSRTSSEYLFEPFTEWMPLVGVDAVRGAIRVAVASSANFSAKLALQYATTRTESPGTWMEYGTAVTGGNEGAFAVSTATDGATKMWYRIGVGHKYTTAAEEAFVTLQASWNACGRIVSSKTLSVLTSPSGAESLVVLTDWLPASEADQIKVAIELVNSKIYGGGTFKYQLQYQTATTDTDTPDGWTDIGSEYTSSDTAVNTGDLELGTRITAKMFVRVGLNFWVTTGSTQADFNVIVGARRYPSLDGWGSAPEEMTYVERDCTKAPLNNYVLYTGPTAVYNYGDAYESAGSAFSVAAYGETSGDPSGPATWGTGGSAGDPYWIGYDAATQQWSTYKLSGGNPTTVGSQQSGAPNALARMTVSASGATVVFDVSFDAGITWTTLYTYTGYAGFWSYKGYLVQDNATYTVRRETVS